MNLFDAHAKGLPLVTCTEAGGERLAAELFRLKKGGVVYADIGWPGATWHPFHAVEGEVRETEDGWAIGRSEVRFAFEGEQLFIDWQDWLAWRRTESGSRYDRALCAEEIRRSGMPDAEWL